MTADEARERFAAARVARLASAGPWLVPICFAVQAEEDLVWTAVDDVKPKSGGGRLRRLREVEADPRVALLADHYDDGDWSQLWWVRADGDARVLASCGRAVSALMARYEQYRVAPPPGPVLEIRVHRWTGWSAAGS